MSASRWTQLKLCLWKHWLLKRRQPFSSLVQIFCPVLMILLLVVIKIFVPSSDFETCQFRARAGPSAGLMAMFQSFVCNIQNDCWKIEEFEDLPTYPGSKLNSIIKYLEPVMYNDTVRDINLALPNVLKLLNGTTEAINDPIFQELINKTTFVSDVFKNKTEARNILTKQFFNDYTVEAFMTSLLRMGMISGDLASISSMLPSFRMSASNIIPDADSKLQTAISDQLLSFNDVQHSQMIEVIQKELDFQKIQNHFGRLVVALTNFTNSEFMK